MTESKKSKGAFVFIDGMDEAMLSYNLPIICGFGLCRNIHEIIIYKTDLASICSFYLYTARFLNFMKFLFGIERSRNAFESMLKIFGYSYGILSDQYINFEISFSGSLGRSGADSV